MNKIQFFDIEEFCDTDAFELLVEAIGGAALQEQRVAAAAARDALMVALDPAQQRLYQAAADAGAEEEAIAARAAVRLCLLRGVAMGAALHALPTADPAAVSRAAAGVAESLLESGLPDLEAEVLQRAVAHALRRASGELWSRARLEA